MRVARGNTGEHCLSLGTWSFLGHRCSAHTAGIPHAHTNAPSKRTKSNLPTRSCGGKLVTWGCQWRHVGLPFDVNVARSPQPLRSSGYRTGSTTTKTRTGTWTISPVRTHPCQPFNGNRQPTNQAEKRACMHL